MRLQTATSSMTRTNVRPPQCKSAAMPLVARMCSSSPIRIGSTPSTIANDGKTRPTFSLVLATKICAKFTPKAVTASVPIQPSAARKRPAMVASPMTTQNAARHVYTPTRRTTRSEYR